MQVRNNTEAPIMLIARTNAGKMVEYVDNAGNKISKPEEPRTELIAIPASATVEIDDTLWLQATSGKTTIREHKEVKEVIPGQLLDKKPVYRTIMEPTGKTREVNLVNERIKAGDLIIVEKVKSKVTTADMIKALASKKITATKESHTEEEIQSLYETLFG